MKVLTVAGMALMGEVTRQSIEMVEPLFLGMAPSVAYPALATSVLAVAYSQVKQKPQALSMSQVLWAVLVLGITVGVYVSCVAGLVTGLCLYFLDKIPAYGPTAGLVLGLFAGKVVDRVDGVLDAAAEWAKGIFQR